MALFNSITWLQIYVKFQYCSYQLSYAMYVPNNMKMPSECIENFIKHHSFALVVSSNLECTHVPLVLVASEGEQGVLYGHVAKANKHWQALNNQSVVAIFSGPHAYISPTWYDSKHAVPTWNYAAVHCTGTAHVLSAEETSNVMNLFVQFYEPSLATNLTLMPANYVQKLQQAIVGFKIVIEKIDAKEKLGQHRSDADQHGVFAALSESNRYDAKQLASYMVQRDVGKPKLTS